MFLLLHLCLVVLIGHLSSQLHQKWDELRDLVKAVKLLQLGKVALVNWRVLS